MGTPGPIRTKSHVPAARKRRDDAEVTCPASLTAALHSGGQRKQSIDVKLAGSPPAPWMGINGALTSEERCCS